MTEALATRLRKGAQVLGALWRSKTRCPFGWALIVTDELLITCDCEPDKETKFCRAKRQWVALVSGGREFLSGDLAVPFMMTASEWDETGLSMKVEVDGVGEIKVGKHGTITMTDFRSISGDPESGRRMLGLLKAFPGSKIASMSKTEVGVASLLPVATIALAQKMSVES